MRDSGAAGMTATTWVGRAAVSIAATLLLVVLWQPAAERGLIGSGAAYTIVTYDQVLPLLGLGIALARLSRRLSIRVQLRPPFGVGPSGRTGIMPLN